MLQLIKNWLSGPKEYFTGVVIYRKFPVASQHLIGLLNQGPTDFSKQKLLDALTASYMKLNAAALLSASDAGVTVRTVTLKPVVPVEEPVATAAPVIINEDLYNACKQDADTLYKEVMNLRAELFALARANDFTDPNMPDKIKAREKLALNVVKGFQQVSALYDKADYVKLHGRLPDQVDEQEEEVPDILVKSTLDNLRKNYNKIKKRPETAERMALLQKHGATIKKLEERWLLLKQKK